ncbi:hypothetical protein P8918_12755 [Bacillus spizizenii]|nr:hypothetical protein [Bacillus spizizenii]MEC0841894.1 hypothetical protein [Bacillus spizizenii]
MPRVGRKVGSFIDPNTGETHWLEVNTVKQIKLSPMSVTRFREQVNYRSMVEFKLDNVDLLKVITLTAEYETNNKVFRSDAIQIDELKFAEHLAYAAFNEETIDNADFMVEMKNAALEDLRGKLLSEGILIEEIELKGAGYIYSKGKKVMTIDGLQVKVNRDTTADVVLRDTVGSISLASLIEPEIVFYSSGFEFKIEEFTIIDQMEGKLNRYTLSVQDISIEETEEEVYFRPFKIEAENEEVIDDFVMDRKGMLDNIMVNDNSFDDRFADIF